MIKTSYTLILSAILSALCSESIASNTPKVVRTDVYLLAHQGDSLQVDMNIDLAPIRLAPDCSLFLLPTLYRGADSLNLPPVLLNGPQSDRMYRRRKALGVETEIEKVTPFLVLREGEHALPRINYLTAVPYQAWMDSADIKLSTIYCNCDDRISRFDMRTFRSPNLVRVLPQKELVTVHDTVYITKTIVLQVAQPDSLKGEHSTAGSYAAVVAGETREFTIYFNRKWHRRWSTDYDVLVAMDSFMRVPGKKRATVVGYTSPEGSYKENQQLAAKRAMAIRNFLENRFGSDNVQITIQTLPGGWDQLIPLVANSQMIGKEAVLETIGQEDDYQKREESLRALNSGTVYKYMLSEFFPQLHKVVIRVTN